jgi:hypothetical protein
MAEVHPRIRRIRRIGVGVFLTVALACVPIALHIKNTRADPELWLTLLGAVLLMVLISLFALETAAAPIPEPRIPVDDADTALDAEEAAATEALEPAHISVTDFTGKSLAEQDTELDPERHANAAANPDGPLLVVPNPALMRPECDD